MSWVAIIGVTEVIGVIAIIGSLIYVAAQIRQNSLIARATIIHGTNSDAMRVPELIASDAELAAIYQKGFNGESLTGTDLVRFLALCEMFLTWLEDIDAQIEANLYFQDVEIEGAVDSNSREVRAYMSIPEVRQWWLQGKVAWRPSFAKKIDKYVDAA